MSQRLDDPATEAAVLGAMLMDARAVVEARAILSAEDFTVAANRRIYAALVSLVERDVEPDPITLSDALEARGELDSVGGKQTIGELIDYVPTAANVAHHARIVRELAERRRMLDLAESLRSAAGDRAVELSETTRTTIEALLPMATAGQGSEGFKRADYWRVMEEIERRGGSDEVPGLPTGYPELDDEIHGFRPGNLVIVGGVAKGGKTALSLAFAKHAMLERKAPVGFVSAEMSADDLMERLLNAESGVPVSRTSSGRLRADDYPRMARAAGVLASARLYIDDAASPTLQDVRARSLALVAKEGPMAMIVVDFLQLIRYSLPGRSKADELTDIAYGLKGLAKRLGCVVVAPCQLNYKDVGRRANTRPAFEDLAGSSGMMMAADVVILTHRQAMYDPTADDDMELQVRGRKIPDFTARLRWDGSHMRILSPRLSPVPLHEPRLEIA